MVGQRPPRSGISGFNSDSFISVTWKTLWLKTRTIQFLRILWVGLWFYQSYLGSIRWLNSADGSAGDQTNLGLLDHFLYDVFHPQGGKTELLHIQPQSSISRGQSPMHKHLSNLCFPPLMMSHWPKQVMWLSPEPVSEVTPGHGYKEYDSLM